jgi:hypothetical protein
MDIGPQLGYKVVNAPRAFRGGRKTMASKKATGKVKKPKKLNITRTLVTKIKPW